MITMEQFEYSSAAARKGIPNKVPAKYQANAQLTLNLAARINAMLALNPWVTSLRITSGYRSPELNTLIGGSLNSDHMRAQAIDFQMNANRGPDQLMSFCRFLAERMDTLLIGQLIYEFGSWIHVSIRRPTLEINRVITIDRYGTRAGIKPIRVRSPKTKGA